MKTRRRRPGAASSPATGRRWRGASTRRSDEAVEWLERAKRTARYEPRHFPHFNLSRVYVMQGRLDAAIRELRAALQIEPGYLVARRELHRVMGMIN